MLNVNKKYSVHPNFRKYIFFGWKICKMKWIIVEVMKAAGWQTPLTFRYGMSHDIIAGQVMRVGKKQKCIYIFSLLILSLCLYSYFSLLILFVCFNHHILHSDFLICQTIYKQYISLRLIPPNILPSLKELTKVVVFKNQKS